MTSFREPGTSRRWPAWSWIPVLLFALVLLNGATLGLSDDEAYYWVISRHPGFGFAYHPPMVAWLIAAARFAFGWALGGTALVRLPAAACVGAVLWLALRWIEEAGGEPGRVSKSSLLLVSFAGYFALSWMIVPDSSLFLGLMLAFVASWRLRDGDRSDASSLLLLALGVAVAILSKYSGVLVALSAAISVWLWTPRPRRVRALLAIAGGVVVALIPILIWNSKHEWASILYQVQERHGGAAASPLRYLRFWLIEVAVAGPLLVFGGIRLVHKRQSAAFSFALAWALPAAAVFCVQPLFSDFKPHWAFVVWWPVALALACEWAKAPASRGWRRVILAQCAYGHLLVILVILSCHWPLLGRWVHEIKSDPRLDVTNDLYGWSGLPSFIAEKTGMSPTKWPVVGGRYQTASQAAYALGDSSVVTLLPRDLKARDEWPMIDAVDGYGPAWPALRAPLLFVSDLRYDSAPEFARANCEKLGRYEAKRGDYLAKWIDLWECVPKEQ